MAREARVMRASHENEHASHKPHVAHRAMLKRISGSGGSSGALAGCITLMTEPAFDGVSVTKYELFESEPTAISVAVPTRDRRTRDKRLSRQLATYAGARCEDT